MNPFEEALNGRPAVMAVLSSSQAVDCGWKNCDSGDLFYLIGELAVWHCRAQKNPLEAFKIWSALVRERIVNPVAGMGNDT